jgi:hypothetical protein
MTCRSGSHLRLRRRARRAADPGCGDDARRPVEHPLAQPELIDRHETYSHNDPNSASPQNDFVDGLVPFLANIKRGR